MFLFASLQFPYRFLLICSFFRAPSWDFLFQMYFCRLPSVGAQECCMEDASSSSRTRKRQRGKGRAAVPGVFTYSYAFSLVDLCLCGNHATMCLCSYGNSLEIERLHVCQYLPPISSFLIFCLCTRAKESQKINYRVYSIYVLAIQDRSAPQISVRIYCLSILVQGPLKAADNG